MIKSIIIGVFLFTSCIFAQTINIAVAANVSYAINDLIKEFNKTNPNIKVNTTLGSSGKLTAQIKNGAPYDIFMSANMKYPNSLFKDKIALTRPIVYAKGSLAIFSSKKRDFSNNIKIIENKNIKRIAVANPKTAPYGIATKEALVKAKLYEKVKNKFIYGESISQTVSYTINASDLGFIAKSALFSPKMKNYKKDINWIEVDSKLYTPINQGLVILKNSKEAKAFYDFILSHNAKDIFTKFGYLIK